MSRLRTALVKCNYKEIDRQLKEQFIHGLNDEEILAEIFRELTKYEENINICNENVLRWTKRVEAQRAQMAVISSLHEAKNFDAIIQKDIKHGDKRPATNTLGTRRRCNYCRQEHKLPQCPVYAKKCDKCSKINHFKEV